MYKIDKIKNNVNISDLIYYIFVFIAVAVFLLKHSMLSILFVLILIIIKMDIIFPLLIIFPVIEGMILVEDSMTITRFIIIIYLLRSVFYVFVKKIKFKFDKNVMVLLLMLLVFLYGFFIINLFPHRLIVGHIDFSETLLLTVITLAKVTMAIFLYLEISQKQPSELEKFIEKLMISISLGALIISLYTLANPVKIFSGVNIMRQTLDTTDPNEMATFLVSFIIYPIYLMMRRKTLLKAIGIIDVLVMTIVITLTLSRGGMVTFLVITLLTFYMFLKRSKKKILYLFIIGSTLIAVYVVNKMALSAIMERFLFGYSSQGMQGLTSNRSDIWQNGLFLTLQNRPVLGFGISLEMTKLLNFIYIGRPNVMHSIYLGMYVQFGLFGLLSVLYLIYRIMNQLFLRIKQGYIFYIMPVISVLAIFIAGITLELEYREILWIFIGISLGLLENIKKGRIEKERSINEDSSYN